MVAHNNIGLLRWQHTRLSLGSLLFLLLTTPTSRVLLAVER